jgi:hypothetical protein
MKRILLFLFFIFLYGCSNNVILEVEGEVRIPRTFSYDELMSLDNSSKIVFWHVLAASGCINGWARDVLVYGDGIYDIDLSNAYGEEVFLVVNGNSIDVIAPEFTVKNVHKIEVINYDYRQKY